MSSPPCRSLGTLRLNSVRRNPYASRGWLNRTHNCLTRPAAQEAAQKEAAAAAAASQREAEAEAAAMGTIFYFDFDSSSLTDEARAQVDAHVAALLGNNDSVRLEGHTDERGTREYNLALGERRANAVRDYMVANGVPSYRIETVSYGEENPVAYGSGESNWQQNRRVELK